jgi:hypothetical protein
MAGKPFDGIARFDDTFFDSLARMVQEEPLGQRDLVAMALLRSIGIEKGRPFQPDAGLREILRGAAIEAHADFIAGLRALPAYWSARQWTLPARPVGAETGFTFMTGQLLDIDARGEFFYFGCAPARRPGAATFYLSSCADAGGAPLQGGRKYRLRVPPEVPAQQFWAVTVYELETCAFVRGAERIELNSYDEGVARNADGSVDVTFAPRPPPAGSPTGSPRPARSRGWRCSACMARAPPSSTRAGAWRTSRPSRRTFHARPRPPGWHQGPIAAAGALNTVQFPSRQEPAVDLSAVETFLRVTLLDVGLKVLAAIAFWLVGAG